MEITTRPFRREDMACCLEIEAATAPTNRYLADVADEFTTTRGELTLGVVES